MTELIRVSGNLRGGKRLAIRICCLSFALAIGVLLLAAGCSDDTEKVTVDFSKTVPVARPGERASPTPPLRVAVAAKK